MATSWRTPSARLLDGHRRAVRRRDKYGLLRVRVLTEASGDPGDPRRRGGFSAAPQREADDLLAALRAPHGEQTRQGLPPRLQPAQIPEAFIVETTGHAQRGDEPFDDNEIVKHRITGHGAFP